MKLYRLDYEILNGVVHERHSGEGIHDQLRPLRTLEDVNAERDFNIKGDHEFITPPVFNTTEEIVEAIDYVWMMLPFYSWYERTLIRLLAAGIPINRRSFIAYKERKRYQSETEAKTVLVWSNRCQSLFWIEKSFAKKHTSLKRQCNFFDKFFRKVAGSYFGSNYFKRQMN